VEAALEKCATCLLRLGFARSITTVPAHGMPEVIFAMEDPEQVLSSHPLAQEREERPITRADEKTAKLVKQKIRKPSAFL